MITTAFPRTNFSFDVASLSNRGKKRSLNEDAIFDLTTHTQAGTQAGLYLVCDGKGNHQPGDTVSQLAVETLVAELVPVMSKYQAVKAQQQAFSTPEVQQHIKDAVSKANQRIHRYNQDKSADRKAETTLTMAFLQDQEAIVANVGDCRAYLWHKGQLRQLTHTHYLDSKIVDDEELVYDEEDNATWTTDEKWAMGLHSTVKADLVEWELEAGDKLLLCSDGLWQAFADEGELATLLYTNVHAQDICRQLIYEAIRRDGSDNVSAVVICAECH
jgi:protein phosphatase